MAHWLSRREALGGAAALAAATLVGSARSTFAAPASVRLFGSALDRGGDNALRLAVPGGEAMQIASLPGRGHEVCVSDDGSVAVVVARRPGTFAVAFDPASLEILRRLESPPDRHFYGHGAFSRDGRLFFATENAFDEDGAGRIGIYDVADGFARVGEWSSHGIGPHDLVRAPGGDWLVAGNGGIRTHPNTGRAKLNVDTMQPSVVVVDGATGALVAEHRLPAELRHLSLRHLAIRDDGRLVVGGQWEGDPTVHTPLVAVGSLADGIAPVPMADGQTAALANYIGSVSLSPDGRLAAASAPRGGHCAIVAVDGPLLVDMLAIEDVCGTAPAPAGSGLYLSDGLGRLHTYDGGQLTPVDVVQAPYAWDNHLAVLPG